MKIHGQGKKAKVVMDWEELFAIAICLSESPVFKNRKLAYKIQRKMDEYNKRSEKK